MTTELLGLDEITSAQASKEVTHNTALRQIEGRSIKVISRTTTAEPGAPAEGDTYILPASSTGTDWAGNDGTIGHFYGGAWVFYTPIEGIRVWVDDEDVRVVYNGSAWTGPRNPIFTTGISTASLTLTVAQCENDIFQFNGSTVSSSIVMYVASGMEKQWTIYNNSSGGANVVNINVAGATVTASGVDLGDNSHCIIYTNGSTVERVTADL